MFATAIILVFVMCTLTICVSMLFSLLVLGMLVVVNAILFLISVMSPPPVFCFLSWRRVL